MSVYKSKGSRYVKDSKHLLWQLNVHKVTGTLILPERLFAYLISSGQYLIASGDAEDMSPSFYCSGYFFVREHCSMREDLSW